MTLDKKIFDKIVIILNKILLDHFDINIFNIDLIIEKVLNQLYNNITDNELYNLIADICMNMSTIHPDYVYLAGNILIANLHQNTASDFSSKMELLAQNTDFIDNDWLNYIITNANELNKIIDYNRDYKYDYFGYKTLEKAYLLKINNKIIERPQDMLLRTAITVQMNNLELIKKTYDYMSLGYYIHATPTLFNSGSKQMQLSSCFIGTTEIITVNGVKYIKDVQINDEIITHTGKIKKVLQCHKNLLNNRKIYKLEVFNTKTIYVTEDHKFLSICDTNLKPSWRSINEIKKYEIQSNNNNYIAMPYYNGYLQEEIINIDDLIYNNIIKIKDNKIVNTIKLNIELSFILGYFILYGNLIKLNNKIIGIYFKGYINNIDIIIQLIQNIFNINIYTKYNYDNIIKIIYESATLGELFNYLLYKNNKVTIWKNMIYWNIELINSFINGLTNYRQNNKIKIFNNNKLTNLLYHLFRLYGIEVYLNNNYELIIPNKNLLVIEKNKSMDCSIENNKDFNSNIIIIEKTKYLKINNLIKTELTPKYVYTLGIEDDHSYNVEGLIAENCFLLGVNDDLSSICKSWNSCSQISKWAGGIGLHISNIRSKNSIIKGTNGKSNGLVPLLRIYNDIARWVDQGGKRPGSIAIYLEPHHPDIFDFLDLRKNFGSENDRTRDLFLALWISDLFMKCVENDENWYLLNPNECPNLNNVYGNEYGKLYEYYVKNKKYTTIVKARKVWMAILDSQIETGMPYISYKDSINKKNNQKNLGVIKSSNLCVHYNTQILTNEGYISIGILKDKEVIVWNGEEWSNVLVKQTGHNQNLIRINFSNGTYIDCTPYHKFYIKFNDNIIEKNACELKYDDTLIELNLPEPIKQSIICINSEIAVDFYQLTPVNINSNLILKYSINERIKWLEQFYNNNNYSIIDNSLHIAYIDKECLLNIRLILHTLGIDSIINNSSEQSSNEIFYILILNSYYLLKLIDLGFKLDKLNKIKNENIVNTPYNIKVISITNSYQNVNTYCFIEPKKHKGVFNGILCGNCNEIVEYSDNDEYAVCNLASIGLKSLVIPYINNQDNNWIIYTKTDCKYCSFAKKYLDELNIKFNEFKYNEENKKQLSLLLQKEIFTYPQIFIKINNQTINIGGWNELYKYIMAKFDFNKLYDVAYLATINLNQIIDINYYPIPEAKKSNMNHRPIGLGIQGLADTLALLKIPYDSNEALEFNAKIMEIIYFASMTASNDIAKERHYKMKELLKYFTDNNKEIPQFEYYDSKYDINNKLYHELKPTYKELIKTTKLGSYSTFEGSLFSEGLFQFDMWNISKLYYKTEWNILKTKVIKYGTRNSLLTALMPTASTSQILGNNECFEYFTNNIYTRRTQAGDFIIVNKYLIKDLKSIGIWSIELKDKIIANNGSIQNIDDIPMNIKKIYKTIWEIKQLWVLKGALARAPFIDQTQSMNIYMSKPDYQRLSSSHFWGWKAGLKTGMYYLRTQPSIDPIKFTIDPMLINIDHEICENCSA